MRRNLRASTRRITTIASSHLMATCPAFPAIRKRYRTCRSSWWPRTRRRCNVLPTFRAGTGAEAWMWAKEDWTRWNDYGIGLFLQGDLKGRSRRSRKLRKWPRKTRTGGRTWDACACRKATWTGAQKVLKKALALKPELARANFFYARVLTRRGQVRRSREGYLQNRAGAISARPRGHR